MFVLSFSPKKMGKKGIAVIAAVAVLAAVGLAVALKSSAQKSTIVYNEEEYSLCAETEEERAAFLESIGCQTKAEADSVTKVTIPEEFNDVYTTYNELQQSVGFDLSDYCGEDCLMYTYTITNSETATQVNLLVCDGVIIGGDIQETESGGVLYSLLDENKMLVPEVKDSNDESEVSVDPSEVSSTERETLAPDPEMPEAPTD